MRKEKLSGGNTNAVWKSGDSVHRTSGPWTATIHRLIQHVRDHGIDFVPEPRGVDVRGDENLSFLAGDVPVYPFENWVWSEALLIDAGTHLRKLHDATTGFPLDGAIWRTPVHDPVEVICHNDFAPYNFVCNSGRLTGVIDWDAASPGSRIWDISYLAYRLCPLAQTTNHDALRNGASVPISEQEHRLALLLASYGSAFTVEETIETAIKRLNELADFSERRAIKNNQSDLREHARLYRSDAVELRRRLTG